jgi:hypothetical protein
MGCNEIAAPIKGTIIGAFSDNFFFEIMFYLFIMVMYIVDASLVLFEVSAFRFCILVRKCVAELRIRRICIQV